MEPSTDNLTTKCSVAFLTSLLTLIFQSVLISQIDFVLHLKKRKWNYLGGKRNYLQHKKHTSNDTSQVQGTWTPRKKNKKMKTKEGAKLGTETKNIYSRRGKIGQRNNRERKSGPIAKSPLIPTFGTIRLKFLFAKIFWNWTKLLLLSLLVPHLWKKVLNRENELFSIFHQFHFALI